MIRNPRFLYFNKRKKIMVEYTLGKKERLNSKTLIERLFLGGSKSFPAFPLRVVYMSVEPVRKIWRQLLF